MRDRSPIEIYDNYLIPQVIENTTRANAGSTSTRAFCANTSSF